MATRRVKSEDSKSTPDRIAEVLGGGEDPLGMSFKGMMGAASAMNAESIARESTRLYNEWLKIMWGTSEREVPPKDWRFADPVWRDNPMYKRLAQGYLAFCDAVDKVVDDSPDWRKRERAKFLTGILTSAMSPTNTLMGNPAALKKAYESGGQSLVKGTQNMVGDMLTGKGLPSQVKKSDFKVGGNLAVTPGAVVFRNEMLEVLQYQPTTAKVHEIPTFMIVPPIGKYYFMDLAPGRSFTEHAVGKGIQYFTTSWRNPHKEHSAWGLDDYVKTLLEAIDAIGEITGSKKVNILGLCAGGIIATLLLNYMAAVGDHRVNAASFGVMLLDFNAEAPLGAFHSKKVLGMARKRSTKKGIMPASSLATVFAWMRPNDLVWNYWVNNYLEGKDPPSFDILAWSVDGTNLPGLLHTQFLDIFENNPLPEPGAMKVLGEPVDLKTIKVDTLVTGALTDHLTPWKACYRTTQLMGGKSTFVLSNAGHIASLVNPPGNPKASYFMGPQPPGPDPEQWLQKAEKRTGTWWEVWTDWTLKRSGQERAAPKVLGSDQHPALAKAPGTYVLEES
jgi:poly[(R)-3-hydroxyalkanoate] polymerase subunit PhaC